MILKIVYRHPRRLLITRMLFTRDAELPDFDAVAGECCAGETGLKIVYNAVR
jgi:hypothetical protein